MKPVFLVAYERNSTKVTPAMQSAIVRASQKIPLLTTSGSTAKLFLLATKSARRLFMRASFAKTFDRHQIAPKRCDLMEPRTSATLHTGARFNKFMIVLHLNCELSA
jgi:hypothetical protein